MKFSGTVPCFILAAALGLSSCKRGPDISQDPGVVGQNLTLTGKVEQIYEPNIVKLDTNRGDLIVITPVAGAPLERGDRVSVTGDMRRLTVAEVERDFDLDLEPELEVEIEGENFLAAREIKPA